MANRTQNPFLPVALMRLASSFARKQNSLVVWTIIAAVLIQQSAVAGISISPARARHTLESALTEAGTVFIDSNSGTKIVRVTDSRDGQARLASRVDSSSFNLDSSRFFVNLDGVPTLYTFDPSSLAIEKQGILFGSLPLQFDSCHWSASATDTIFGLGSADSARIYAYDTRSGSNTLLKDFAGILPNGEAQNLSKSWSDDNHFAFILRESGSAWRFGVVWDRTSDRVYLFDATDSVSGVTAFHDAHLDRSGEALIVNGDVTRVWRYRTQQQSDAVQLESNGDSGVMKTMAQEDDAFDLFGSTRSRNFPANDLSPDRRFSIFPSSADGSRSDMFIAAVNISATASNVTWTHMVNCTAAANSLQKTGGIDQADDAHATSTQGVLSGDAYVEFTAEEADKERWCGLNNSNAIHDSSSDINFAIKLANNKKANVVENGVVKAKIKYKSGNVLRVAVESGVVNYYRNGSVFYTSTATPTYPLLVNASLVDKMALVSSVMISILNIGAVVSISPSKASVATGTTSQFTALVTGSSDTITWSATGGSVTSAGLYTAPATAGTYSVRAFCTSNPNIGASATASVSQSSDTTPPVISGVNASNITGNGVTISWTTDELSDTQIEYGPTSGYGALSTQNPALVTNHSVAFGGLASAVVYHYRVKSKDAAGNLAVSGDLTFTTPGGSDATPPVITGVSSTVTANSATIVWNTNEASDTQVEYGTTSGYGSSTALNASMVASHSAFLSGLSAGATYHHRVKSKDAAGNLATSGDFTFTTTSAAPPPPSSGVITNRNVYPEPAAPALPKAGGTYVDPIFGTTIMRVTDENDGTSNMNYYSYWPTFNLDSTRFFISCDYSPRLYKFDPNNFQIISKGPLFTQPLPGGGSLSTEDAIWSGTNPDVLYGYAGLKLWAYNVSAGTYTLIKDFTGELSPGSLGQMSKSVDDNVFAFTKKDSNYAPTGYLVWQRDQNKILRNVSLGNYDEVEIDKSGRYLVVKAEFGGGVDFQDIDLQTGTVQSLTDPSPDFSPGHSDNGRQIVVGHDNWNNRYTSRSLATPHQFLPVISFGSDWSQGNHVSMLADNEAWCVISNFNAGGSGPVGPFHNEIFQASTDGNQNVRRLAQHRSVYRDYWDTPRAEISRDGRFVAYTSNWGSTTRRDVFIIKVPQGTGSSGSGDTTPPVISGVSASSSGVINWTTNEASDSQIEYGATTAYGSGTALNTSMVTSHSASLGGLAANTLYHYRVRSKDAAGNQAISGDFSLTTPTGGGGAGSTQNVVWTGVVNCSVSGNSLQKTSGKDDESDAGAASQQQIVSGDGYVELTAGAGAKIRFCGLTHTVSGTQFTAIDFAIKLTEFGVAEVRENNAYQSEISYTSSDVFRVAVQGGVVKYSKNGAVFYTSGSAPSYPLRVDATFIHLSGTVNNAVVSAGPGGSLAVNSVKSQSAEVANVLGLLVVPKDLWLEISREREVGAILPLSLPRAFVRA
ncbi:MAG: hypothetical protein DMF60_03375 [Acidobacteria bacterium]|nr:MAG: hypothetical protein DMF60_03375 [Acidobacteriota bacterium]